MAQRRVTMDEIEKVAQGLLLDFKELPGFNRARMSDVHPIYDTKEKDRISHYEVKFSSPEGEDNGYAIISATIEDYPVVEFSEEGRSHHELFQESIGDREFNMVRFDSQYIVAEDTEGNLLSEIGNRPIIIPKSFRKHKRSKGKEDTGKIDFREIPGADLKTFVTETEILNYKEYKREFRKRVLNVTKIEKAWIHALEPRGNPGCVYEYFWADGFSNRPLYKQIPKNTPPNNNDHASGCGPTAWMNLFGWHDLNWEPDLLSGSRKFNDNYIDSMTMELHDHLGTYEPWFTFGADEGFTWPEDMVKGYSFARKNLHYDYSYGYNYDYWNTDEEEVFEVARSVAQAKRPFIVGYFQEWHYALGYGIAECKTHGWKEHSWLKIYPGISAYDKWIPMGTIFGIYGVYKFNPLMEFIGIENPQELRITVNGPGDVNQMFIYTGIATFISRGGIGANWFHDTISFEVGNSQSISSNEFRNVVATASLASIANKDHAVNAGWAVDEVEAIRSTETDKIRLKLKLAVRDIDGYLYRIAYKVTVLAHISFWEGYGAPPPT